ncbi:hypothetical protein CHS0354_029031 [Potamilus streckersoni]|uniref:Hydroxysteroid dehydrogenase-like protein 2 n=1 Tax=Potamilus streckersoni TaxID=2493646 RepID=A0AAE0VV62_9BIVA|nr:hypothetical protein CHS0354_029031 [Potamilus streckersoni]
MAENTGNLRGKTLFITGASRGIGKAIALKAAKDGANIVIAAKTAEPHPKLPGTIYTAAKEIEDAGGKCLPCIVDIRFEDQVKASVELAVKRFGGIDILVNNASAISLTGTLQTSMKKYDLMMGINVRGTYLCSRICIPYLRKSQNPHILTISPPLNLKPKWFQGHVAILTAAVTNFASNRNVEMICRKPDIMADAAYVLLCKNSKSYTGNFAIDEHVLREAGVKDMEQYSCVPGRSKAILFPPTRGIQTAARSLLSLDIFRRTSVSTNEAFRELSLVPCSESPEEKNREKLTMKFSYPVLPREKIVMILLVGLGLEASVVPRQVR